MRVLKWRVIALRKWLHFGRLASQENRKLHKHLQQRTGYTGDRGAETPGEDSTSRKPVPAPTLGGTEAIFPEVQGLELGDRSRTMAGLSCESWSLVGDLSGARE